MVLGESHISHDWNGFFVIVVNSWVHMNFSAYQTGSVFYLHIFSVFLGQKHMMFV